MASARGTTTKVSKLRVECVEGVRRVGRGLGYVLRVGYPGWAHSQGWAYSKSWSGGETERAHSAFAIHAAAG